MRSDVISLILKEENMLDKKNIIRNILSFLIMGVFFISFIMPYLNIKFTSGKSILPGLMLITFYYSITFIYSKLKSKEIILYKIMPFKSYDVFLGYIRVIFTNCILKKIVVFLLPIYLYTIIIQHGNVFFLLGDFIKINLILSITLFLSIAFSLEIFNKKVMIPIAIIIFQILMINKYLYNNIFLVIIALYISFNIAKYCFSKDFKFLNINRSTSSRKKISFFRREFIRFYNEKILVTNHLLTLIMIFIFTVSYIIFTGNIDVSGYLILIMPGFITTPSVIFSIEKDIKDLINMLPVNKNRFFIDKYIFLLSIIIPYYIVIFALFIILNIEGFNFELGTLIIFNALLNCILKMYLDYSNPFFNYSHVKLLLENNRRYKFYVISLICGIPVLISSFIGIASSFVLEVILTMLLVIYINYRYKKDALNFIK